jgi:RNA polymerase sigma factor (sigma-70 family)
LKSEPLPELLKRCQAGENGAVASLVQRFQPWLHRYSASIVRDEDLAEDTVREAFAAALDKLDDLRDPQAFQDWLRHLARTYAYRILRKRRELPLDDDHDEPSQDLSPAEQLQRKELRQKVREAIERSDRGKGKDLPF